jgi:hypothetical protein
MAESAQNRKQVEGLFDAARSEKQILLNSQMHENRAAFGKECQTLASAPVERIARRLASPHYLSPDDREFPAKSEQCGALPRAVRAEERNNLPIANVQVEVVNHR